MPRARGDAPPRLARRLAKTLVPAAFEDEVLGDLEEAYARRRKGRGAAAADRWYWRQVLSIDWIPLHRALAPRARSARPKEEFVHSLSQDLAFAVRSFRRNPGFTFVVVLTLALGIGANVALVSVVSEVLLQPLPYGDQDRLVAVWSQWSGFPKTWVSLGEYRQYREEMKSFESVALYDTGSGNLTGENDPEWVGLSAVSVNLFDVLGVAPTLGRAFTAEEAVPEESEVVLLSHGLWQRRYGSDPEIVGSRVELDGRPRTVVGVLPEGFRLPVDFGAETSTDVFLPLDVPPGAEPLPPLGGSHGSFAVARLALSADVESARAEVAALNARAQEDGVYPQQMRFQTLVVPLAEDILGDVRPALLLLLAAVGFVLLIACTNVANVVLSRGQERRREIALRTALGAGASRLFWQLMTESVVLSIAGGVFGILLARFGLPALIALEPGSVPRLAEARLDGTVLLTALGLTFATAVLFGAFPSLTASRADVRSALVEGARRGARGAASPRLRGVLVVLQVAMAVVLVAGASLMIRTFVNLVAIDPGFRPDHVLTLRLALPAESYPDSPSLVRFYDRLLERVRELPGADRAAAVRVLPLAARIGDWGMLVEGYVPTAGENPAADWQVATEDYVETMGIPLLEGRTFTAADRADSEPVALVNRAFVERYWPGESGVGKRLHIDGADDPPMVRIVGVVGDVRHNGITAEIKQKWYRPLSQFHQSSGFTPRAMTLTVRTSVPPGSLTWPIREVVRELDPKLPIAAVRTLDDVLASSIAGTRFTMALLVLFSGLAVVLAVVGVYGVVSYLVGQRISEIGLRLALGATPGIVLRMVVGQGLFLAALGVVLGSAAALATTSTMARLIYGVAPHDPVTFVIVPLVLLAAALAGCSVPALRASRIDPVVALRAE